MGKRIAKLLSPDEHVRMVVSPFERTLQTADELRKAFESQITYITFLSRISFLWSLKLALPLPFPFETI